MENNASGKGTALIIMDCQCAIIGTYVSDREGYLDRVQSTISAARSAGVLPIYVKVAFRPGHPEISSRNRMFGPIAENDMFLRGEASFEIESQIAPQEDDIVIEKRRVSSFEGTDLEIILRSQKIDTLALCGVMTSGCVLSTLRRAADLDYRLTVIEDLCADIDSDVQDVLMKKVFPSQADVVSSSAFIAQLAS